MALATSEATRPGPSFKIVKLSSLVLSTAPGILSPLSESRRVSRATCAGCIVIFHSLNNGRAEGSDCEGSHVAGQLQRALLLER